MVLVDRDWLECVSEMNVMMGEVERRRDLRFRTVGSLLHPRQFQVINLIYAGRSALQNSP